MDATVLLTYEHRCLEELFDELQRAGTDADARRRLGERITRAVCVHVGIEDAVLYPEIERALDGGAAVAGAARGEHRAVLRLLAALPDPERDPAGWRAALDAVADQTRAHAAEEEVRLLPTLAGAVGPERMAGLGKELEKARKIVPTRPSGHLAATGPGTGEATTGGQGTGRRRVGECGSRSEPTTPATP